MKFSVKNAALVTGILAIGLSACRKEGIDPIENFDNAGSIEIESLLTQSDLESHQIDVVFVENNDESYFEASDEGLPTDFLVEEDYLNETPSGTSGGNASTGSGSVNRRKHIRGNSFIRCLIALNLDSSEYIKIRRVLSAYHSCKSSAVARAQAIHENLVSAYKDKVSNYRQLLKDGKITRKEYNEIIERLRAAFAKELKSLQLREKLQEAFRDCHKKMLVNLKSVLSDDDWKAFVSCYRK